jgi:hypothetical protein
LPECLDDFIDESNPVRVHPSVLLKLYIYGYLKRVQSSRRLEREAGRNVEVMWLLGRAWFTAIMLAGLRGQISEKRIYVGLDVSS